MVATAQDAHPFPIYNARYRVLFPIFDADGDLVTGAASLDTELSQDTGTFADATNEATEIATSSGMYYLDLVAGEMDTKSTAVIVKTSTSGAKTTPLVLNPVRLPVLRTGTAQAGAASTITLDAGASAQDDYYNGCYVNITNNTPTNAQGQARLILDYVGSTRVATIEGTWGTNPSSSSTFEILVPPSRAGVVEWAGVPLADQGTPGVPEVDLTYVNGTVYGSAFVRANALQWASQATATNDIAIRDTLVLGTQITGIATANVSQWDGQAVAAVHVNGVPLVDVGRWDGTLVSPFQPGGLLVDTIVASVTDQTHLVLSDIAVAVSDIDDSYTQQIVVLGDVSNNNYPSVRRITDYVGSTKTITLNAAADFTVLSGDLLRIYVNQAPKLSEILSDQTAFAGANIDAAISSRATPAQVNAEVLDVLNTDTFAEPGVGAPPATATLVQKIGYLFKFLRNRSTSTATTLTVYNDDGTTAAQQATHSDDTTTYDRGEWGSA